ncbi:hypothetical protein DLM45_06670 [Hyphomicrobium methylovorum]|uniref:hypothetical protein n=1 Tax=Hyphomicrobium methylovorum TaxID=84 RepID=UPI0015E6F0A2|nr:hypothetical protein [Hyphomicrobium methylovorum]MBA2125906.1 hypothetical protein [Hyphomicrobium methylovorum]
MKMLMCALAVSAVAGLAPQSAAAADLGYYYGDEERFVERRAPVVVERRYEAYDYDYYDEPVETYYRRSYRSYPYYAAAYPYRWYGGRHHHHHHRHYRGW